jgi:hypothetical protein
MDKLRFEEIAASVYSARGHQEAAHCCGRVGDSNLANVMGIQGDKATIENSKDKCRNPRNHVEAFNERLESTDSSASEVAKMVPWTEILLSSNWRNNLLIKKFELI